MNENIYTQEMYDSGRLPDVGMEALYSFNSGESKFRCDIRYITDRGDVVIYSIPYECEMIIRYDRESVGLYPIDTRTDKERAVDDLKTFINDYSGSIELNILNAIRAGRIHGVTFTENKND